MLRTLHQKVTEVYTRCIGGNEATISTLQMLTSIETRLEELFETVEGLPPERVETAEKVLHTVWGWLCGCGCGCRCVCMVVGVGECVAVAVGVAVCMGVGGCGCGCVWGGNF